MGMGMGMRNAECEMRNAKIKSLTRPKMYCRGDRPRLPALAIGTALTITAICLLLNCGGGFKSDGEGADILGPGIFGPDTAR